jgi:hypothetical protein
MVRNGVVIKLKKRHALFLMILWSMNDQESEGMFEGR